MTVTNARLLCGSEKGSFRVILNSNGLAVGQLRLLSRYFKATKTPKDQFLRVNFQVNI